LNIKDYKPIKIIGQGAFGEVRLCVHETGIEGSYKKEIVAVKKLKKADMHTKNQVLHIRSEKEILSEATSEWIVNLKCSFQVL